MSLKLSRDQRASLFAGDPVKLTFPGGKPCPVKPGHVEVLSAHVKLEVTGVRRTSKGEHALVYTLHNENLGQRFLSRRGDEHGYTHTGTSDVDKDAGEAVDDFTQKRITREARSRERSATADVIVAAEDVMAAIRERAEGNPEFKREARLMLHRMRREVDRFIERQKRKAA